MKMTAIEKPDILSTIQSEGIELKQRGRYHWACCPFHGEKTPSLKVDSERQFFYCFGCLVHGDVIAFIQKLKGISFKDALAYLDINTGKPSPEALQAINRQKEKAEIIRKFRQWAADYHSELCGLYRCLQNAKDNCRTIEDAEGIAEFYHKEPQWIYHMDILEGRDDRAKFEVYCEVNGNGNF